MSTSGGTTRRVRASDPDAGPRPLRTALAAVSVLASAWPLTHLFTASPWTGPAVLQVLMVALVGLGLRALGVGHARVAAVQAVAIVVTQSYAFAPRDALLGGLVPTPGTLAHWRDLGAEAARTIMENAAPAPANAGVAFAISAAVAVVAWAVDVVSVGSRMPAVAGLPLLTPFLTAVANSSAPLPAGDAVVPLALWALMLLEQERDWLSSWRPDLALTHRLPAVGRRLLGGVAVAAVAIALGLAAAGTLPHLPQRYLADGLGRGDLARGHRVGFSPNSDMLLDLRSGDQSPVLTYRSDDPESPPLRVSVATRYESGRWSPDEPQVRPSRQPELPLPAGLTQEVPRTERHFRVDQTGLAAPYLATPVPVIGGTVVGARWAVQDISGVPVVDGTPRSYDLTYLSLHPTPQQLQRNYNPDDFFYNRWLEVPPEAASPILQNTTAMVVREAVTPYDAAVRIQEWLRDAGDFTYSLELTPPPAGMSRREAAATAVDRFLTTKRGYCVQFATTMVLMARVHGIPARLATGFLPGRADGDQRVVVASDAHAWPELYFEGAGWLRFEPTPSVRSGSAPSYTLGVDPTGGSTATTTATVTQTASAPDTGPLERPDTDVTPNTGTGEATDAFSVWPLLQGAALLAALLSVVPAVAAAVRARRRERARDVAAAAETEWLILSERLEDLGVSVPAAATPRQLHLQLTDRAVLDRDCSVALRRVLHAVEDARYAAPTAVADRPSVGGDQPPRAQRAATTRARRDLRRDASAVVKGASSLRSRSARLRAALLPRAGLRALRLPVPRRRGTPPRH